MIRIGIVEDEEVLREGICKSIENAVGRNDALEISSFASGEAFLEKMRGGFAFDILFTDIQMGAMSGVELGKKVRKIQPELYIIFITSYAEYAAESYIIDAYQYILKQDMEYRLPIVMSQLIDKITCRNRQYRMVGTNSEKNKIIYRDIIYIYKSKGAKYVNFVTADGEYRERITLEQVFRELDSKEFVLVDRGYIVNMKRICKVTGDTIYMEEDHQVQIGRSKVSEVKKEINRYWRDL